MFFKPRPVNFSDHELISLISKGDEKAFRELLKRYQKNVYRFSYQFIGDSSEAEDIAQETFLRLYEMSSSFQPHGTVQALIMQIAKNLCIDFLRRHKPVFSDNPPDLICQGIPDINLYHKEILQFLSSAVRNLPENQRTAILLRHTEGLHYAEIADVMGTSVRAVESLLVRARKTLKKHMDDLEFNVDEN